MGFEKRKRNYLLDFAGTDLEGLEIRMSGLKVAELLELEELRQEADSDTGASRKVISFFTEKIQSWNLTEEGVPVPVSMEAVLELEPRDMFAALDRWQEAVAGVSAPLERPSSGGNKWVGEPIPMETRSGLLPH